MSAGPRRRTPSTRVLVVAGGLFLGANLMVFAALSQDTDSGALDVPAEIQQLIPEPGTLMRPQDEVGVDLRDDLIGVLAIDDDPEIPEDQYQRVVDLGRVVFRPGLELEYRELAPGPHTVTVTYWLRSDERDAPETAVFSYTWEFTVG